MIREKSKKYPGVYWRQDEKTGERSYYIRYRLGGRESKLIDEPVGKSSAAMTEAKAAQVRVLRMTGKDQPNTERRAQEKAVKEAEAGRWTVQKIWDEYDKAHKDRSSAKPDRSYASYFLTDFGEKIPEDLVTLDIEHLRRDLAKRKSARTKKPLSAQTQKHVLALLKRMLKWAADMGHIAPPAHLKFKMPTVDNEKTEFMSEDQLQAYFEALDEEPDQDDAAFFRLALFTGIRKTALLNLQWSDVDLEGGYLTLRGAVAKNDKTQTVPLSQGAVQVLKRITRRESSYVWPGADGGPREGFTRMGRRLRKKAGLPKDFRPCHGLRHHFASTLASSGKVDLYSLQKLLTHGSSAMTQRYAHLSDEALKRAVATVDDMLSRQIPKESIGNNPTSLDNT
ncbi:integrase [Desulfomicrobium macestii]|uniref:Integrase n=1 Tax=Desulfomicrobium macestii TaxID=90731 RepID=A0ABR9H8G8_9BACT|nr:site-specific integrase [Desulfomicrobium macestii]MBE1427001.1 integrase [Desulfomicrobium macestii]